MIHAFACEQVRDNLFLILMSDEKHMGLCLELEMKQSLEMLCKLRIDLTSPWLQRNDQHL